MVEAAKGGEVWSSGGEESCAKTKLVWTAFPRLEGFPHPQGQGPKFKVVGQR